MTVIIKSAAEIEGMRKAGRIVAMVLEELGRVIKPGISLSELDQIADGLARKNGARSAFKGQYGFPKSLCTAVNEQVVHGIPHQSIVLKEGDIVGCDYGAWLNGWYGDAAYTYMVGKVSPEAERLVKTTQEALNAAIEVCRPGYRVSDIGHVIQTYCEERGFSVVRDLVGHGIGRKLHEDPQVPNYGSPGRGRRLQAGMVLAIEPMINMGGWEVETLDDEWTVVTRDRSLSAHFEHTVAITEDGPQILTALK